MMNDATKIRKKFLTKNSFSEKQKLKDKEKKSNYKVDEIIQTHILSHEIIIRKKSKNFKITVKY